MNSLLAFSACHMAWITRNTDTSDLMLQYKGFAINGLRRSLHKFSESISEAVLAASILLLWQANEWCDDIPIRSTIHGTKFYSSCALQAGMGFTPVWNHESNFIVQVLKAMAPAAKRRSELAMFWDRQNSTKHGYSLEIFCGSGPTILDTLTADLLDMENSLVYQLHGSHISELLQFIQKIQCGGPFADIEDTFDRLRPLKTWLLWLPPALFAGQEEVSALIILSQYDTAAVAITSTFHFPDLKDFYLGSLSLPPLAFVQGIRRVKGIMP
ncbi:hypothetical protein N7532_007197, partial [Penicillium argentinense]